MDTVVPIMRLNTGKGRNRASIVTRFWGLFTPLRSALEP